MLDYPSSSRYWLPRTNKSLWYIRYTCVFDVFGVCHHQLPHWWLEESDLEWSGGQKLGSLKWARSYPQVMKHGNGTHIFYQVNSLMVDPVLNKSQFLQVWIAEVIYRQILSTSRQFIAACSCYLSLFERVAYLDCWMGVAPPSHIAGEPRAVPG